MPKNDSDIDRENQTRLRRVNAAIAEFEAGPPNLKLRRGELLRALHRQRDELLADIPPDAGPAAR